MSDKSENPIQSVMSTMLEPVGLDEGHLNTTLGSMMQGGVDYADLATHADLVVDTRNVYDGAARAASDKIFAA